MSLHFEGICETISFADIDSHILPVFPEIKSKYIKRNQGTEGKIEKGLFTEYSQQNYYNIPARSSFSTDST